MENPQQTTTDQDVLSIILPIIDMEKFMIKSEGWEHECKLTAECLHDTGVIIIRDHVNINV